MKRKFSLQINELLNQPVGIYRLVPGRRRLKRTLFLCAVVILCAALVLTACSGGASQSGGANVSVKNPVQGGTLKLYCQKPDSYNPLQTKIASVSKVLSLVYEPLYALDAQIRPVPVLAKTYSVSADGLTYSIHLQEGVTFHDGSTFSARDVVYTYRQILDGDSSYRENLYNVSDVRAVSDVQVDFILNARDAGFLSLLTFPIIRENSAATTTSGTGPFRIDQTANGKTMLLSANEQWHGAHRPYIDQISIVILDDAAAAADAFEINLVDVFERPYDSVESVSIRKESGKMVVPTNVLTFVGVNCHRPALADAKVRSALSMLVDKQTIISQVLFENASLTQLPLHPESSLFPQGYAEPTFDVKAAVQALTEAGFEDTDQDGVLEKRTEEGEAVELSLSLLVCSEDSRRYQIANLLTSMLKEGKVQLQVEILDYETYMERIQAGDYDLYVGDISLLNNFDLSALLFAPDGGLSMSGYQSSQMNALLESLRIASDENLRRSAFEQFGSFFRQETPFIPICFNENVLYYNSNLNGLNELFFESPYETCYDWFLSAKENV